MKASTPFSFLLLTIGVVLVLGIAGVAGRGTPVNTHDDQTAEYQKKLNEIANDIVEDRSAVGFSKLEIFYKEHAWFRPRCHEFALALGAEVYQRQQNPGRLTLGPESVLCNYGFYQEYPRSLLLDGGAVDRAVHFCTNIGDTVGRTIPDVEAECFRGIGRGLPFLARDLHGDQVRMATYAVEQCAALSPTNADYNNCVSGLFNKLGRDAQLPHLQENDPLSLCDTFEPTVRARCIGNYKWVAVPHATVTTFTELDEFLRQEYPQGVATTTLGVIVWSLGYDTARRSVGANSFARYIQTCAHMPRALIADCVEGYSTGLAKHGTPNRQYHEVISYCRQVKIALPFLKTTVCPAPLARAYLQGMYAPHIRDAMCREFKTQLGVACE